MFEPTHVLKDLDGRRLVMMGSDTEQSLLFPEEAFVRDEVGTKIICLKRQLTAMNPSTFLEEAGGLVPPSSEVLSPAATAARIEATNPQGMSPYELSRIRINTTSLVAATAVGAITASGTSGETLTYSPTTFSDRTLDRTLDDYVQGEPNRPMLAGGKLGKLTGKTLAALEVAYALALEECDITVHTRDAMTQAQCRALIRHGYVRAEDARVGHGIEWISVTPAGAARVQRIRDERE